MTDSTFSLFLLLSLSLSLFLSFSLFLSLSQSINNKSVFLRFCELSVEEPSQAIHYLQTKLSDLVDKDNPMERDQVGEHTAIHSICTCTCTLHHYCNFLLCSSNN